MGLRLKLSCPPQDCLSLELDFAHSLALRYGSPVSIANMAIEKTMIVIDDLRKVAFVLEDVFAKSSIFASRGLC